MRFSHICVNHMIERSLIACKESVALSLFMRHLLLPNFQGLVKRIHSHVIGEELDFTIYQRNIFSSFGASLQPISKSWFSSIYSIFMVCLWLHWGTPISVSNSCSLFQMMSLLIINIKIVKMKIVKMEIVNMKIVESLLSFAVLIVKSISALITL